jgi:ABC-type taurine transport system ATPase subunit
MNDPSLGREARAPPLIEFRRTSMEYLSTSGERTTVFQAINLTIYEGELFCVIGQSGCGKTTLLNIIAGFVMPTSGDALANGRQIEEPGADRGCVFQEYSLFPWLTVEQNVEFGLRSRGVPSSASRALPRDGGAGRCS